MLDLRTQTQFVDATASIMRAYLRAATETMAASAGRSMSLWSELLQPPSAGPPAAGQSKPMAPSPGMPAANWMPSPMGMSPWSTHWSAWPQSWWLGPSVKFWMPLADQGTWGRGSVATWTGAAQAKPSSKTSDGTALPAPDAGFASYRSAGGHATAQVIVPTIEELAEVTAKAALSPMQTVLGVWRAALGA